MKTEISEDGFIHMLQHLNGGAVLGELEKAITDGLKAVRDNGGQANITLKIGLKHAANTDGVVIISDDVITKFPEEKRKENIMFETAGLGLASQDQRQESLKLEDPVTQTKATLTPVSNISGDEK